MHLWFKSPRGTSLWKAASGTVLILSCAAAANLQKDLRTTAHRLVLAGEGPPILWRDPVDIALRNLRYGPGGQSNEPRGRFIFEQEDMEGSNPKFDVVDQDGVKWKVKMGSEARPETAASRLLWAVGYFANEDYFVPVLHVQNMPHLRRGENLVSADGAVHNVRLKKHLKDENKIGTWSWSRDPFAGTREWYGLRVLMAVINNWDLKDSNNSIYQARAHGIPEQHYVVSDLGSSFGATGLNWRAKGDLNAYAHSKLISRRSPAFVDFGSPSAPKFIIFVDPPELTRRLNLRWLAQRIPTADAVWMGRLLGRLSAEQIRDAFRAAGYGPEEVGAYTSIVEGRITELESL